MGTTLKALALPKRAPITIAHYTTLSGLKGIVDTGQMWASNVSYLNDRRELEHGLEASLKAIKALTSDTAHKQWHGALRSASDALEAGAIPNTYATCFCEQPDILSQWRGYSGAEQGVSVSFDRSKLVQIFKCQGAQLHPVIYGNITTTEKMTAAVKAQLENLSNIDIISAQPSEALKNAAAHSIICLLLPQFKHLGFKDERELRFIVQRETLEEDVEFRVATNVLVPFVKLGKHHDKLPIRTIKVGPGRDQALSARSIRLFLDSRGYQDVSVTISNVPFRS